MATLLIDLAQGDAAPGTATPGTTTAQDGGTQTSSTVVQESQPVGTTDVYDGQEPPRKGPPGGFLVPAIAMFAIFYFLLIRPEKRRRQKVEEMLGAVKKGDRVMTTGGMLAQVAAIHDDEVTLQVDEGVRIKFAKSSIQSVLGKDGDSKDS